MAKLKFNVEDVDLSQFEPLPEGKYIVAIESSEEKKTKSGTGSYIQLVFSIIDGKGKGRKLFHNLNLDNPNDTAVRIAQQQLALICTAVGKKKIKDTNELHNKPLVITVECENRTDKGHEGEIQNRIKKFEVKVKKEETDGAEESDDSDEEEVAPRDK